MMGMINVIIANTEDIPQISLVLATSWKTFYCEIGSELEKSNNMRFEL